MERVGLKIMRFLEGNLVEYWHERDGSTYEVLI